MRLLPGFQPIHSLFRSWGKYSYTNHYQSPARDWVFSASCWCCCMNVTIKVTRYESQSPLLLVLLSSSQFKWKTIQFLFHFPNILTFNKYIFSCESFLLQKLDYFFIFFPIYFFLPSFVFLWCSIMSAEFIRNSFLLIRHFSSYFFPLALSLSAADRQS